jgi:hypothetical protein
MQSDEDQQLSSVNPLVLQNNKQVLSRLCASFKSVECFERVFRCRSILNCMPLLALRQPEPVPLLCTANIMLNSTAQK